jgi:hypothetical protein
MAMTFHKILCPTDFSPGSQPAVRAAARIAAAADADLVIANVWYLPAAAYAGDAPVPSDAVRLTIGLRSRRHGQPRPHRGAPAARRLRGRAGGPARDLPGAGRAVAGHDMNGSSEVRIGRGAAAVALAGGSSNENRNVVP